MNSDLLHVRVSSLPLASLCAGSVRTRLPVSMNTVSTPAREATAAHAVVRRLAELGSVDRGSVNSVAARHGVNPKTLHTLASMATRLWHSRLPDGNSLSDCFPNALTEVDVETAGNGVHVTGHADIVSVTDTVVRVGDWKFGWKDSDYGPQLRGYAAVILLQYEVLTEATATVLWVRDGDTENYTMGRAEAQAWLAELGDHICNWDGVYHPGNHCEWCQASHVCEAAAANTRRTIQAFQTEPRALSEMTPDELFELLDTARSVARYAERAVELVRGRVIKAGTLTGESHELTTKDKETRELLPLEGFLALQQAGFTDADLASVMSLSLPAAEQVAKSKVRKGRGARAIRALRAHLEEAGAILTTTSKRLVTRRI